MRGQGREGEREGERERGRVGRAAKRNADWYSDDLSGVL